MNLAQGLQMLARMSAPSEGTPEQRINRVSRHIDDVIKLAEGHEVKEQLEGVKRMLEPDGMSSKNFVANAAWDTLVNTSEHWT